MMLLRATLASSVAFTAAGVTKVEAQSASASAYREARLVGTISALERFIEAYPLSPEAGSAFRDIVLLRRGSSFGGGPAGLAPAPAPAAAGPSRGIDAY